MKTALVVIDVQRMLIEEGPYGAGDFIDTVNHAIKTFRENGSPVIFIQHTNEELIDGSDGWKISERLDVREEDIKVKKTYNSMFRGTELEDILEENDIQALVICGMQTDYCVDTSVKVAFEKGYELYILKGGYTTFDSEILSARDINMFYENIWSGNFAEGTDTDRIKEILEKR